MLPIIRSMLIAVLFNGVWWPSMGHAEGRGEAIGTSCADCPNFSGAFSITNQTGVPIKYQVRWGNKHDWKGITLDNGHTETHSYPLGEDPAKRVPTPFVRFDDFGGDERNVTYREYRMQFHAVGYAGYGPTVNKAEPKRYHFAYMPDGKHLDLKAD